jgi:hypothetical protein
MKAEINTFKPKERVGEQEKRKWRGVLWGMDRNNTVSEVSSGQGIWTSRKALRSGLSFESIF